MTPDKKATHHFNRGIWMETAVLYREKIALILLVAGGFAALDMVDQLRGDPIGGIANAVIWATLAISVHATVLNGSHAVLPNTRNVFFPFFWRSLVLAIPGVVVSFTAVVVTGHTSEIAIIMLLGLSGFTSAIVPSVAGTWLAAVVATNGDRSLSAALNPYSPSKSLI